MLHLYCRQHGQIVNAPEVRPGELRPDGLFWIDLIEPTAAESEVARCLAGIDTPTREQMREIEPTSRLYREGLALYMTASVLANTETERPETGAVTFIVVDGLLVTIRYCDPKPFETFRHRISVDPAMVSCAEMALTELIDAIVDRIADTLEMVEGEFTAFSNAIFAAADGSTTGTDYTRTLKHLGLNAIRCSRADESLIGLSRLLTFFDANLRQTNQKTVRVRVKDAQRDIVSLMGYAERLSEKLQLLLDATLGLVNIQQNNIIKIFSVIAVIFLPPTLVASIYGMNFHFIPELNWEYGYFFALLIMLASAVLPYVYFKRRGWL